MISTARLSSYAAGSYGNGEMLLFPETEQINLRQLLLSCKAQANLCRARMPNKSKKVIEDWAKILDSAVNNVSM